MPAVGGVGARHATTNDDEAAASMSSAIVLLASSTTLESGSSTTTTSPQQLLAQEAIGGLSAGIVGTVLGYPLDTIKARQQILGSTSSSGIVGTAQHIVRQEGVVGLYRGLVPPLISLSVLNTLNFTLYSHFQQQLRKNNDAASIIATTMTANVSSFLRGFQFDNALAGASVGTVASIVSTVENFVKTQLQIDNTRSKPRFTGSGDCVRQVVQHGGPVGGVRILYTGHVINTLREMTFLATYFGVYEGLRELLVHGSTTNNDTTNHAWRIPVAGGMAGATAWVVSFPLDCVRAGVQGQDVLGSTNRQPTASLSAIEVFRNLIRQRGWMGLYSGVLPSIVRAFVVSGSRFTAYETALWFLRGGR